MTVETLVTALKTIPSDPGVYRMVDSSGKDLYIGKAKNLYKRVSSYTRVAMLPHRLKQMVHHVQEVRVLVTKTELEALLLEANLISRYQPPYNILLKAGQSFSYLVISEHPFPRVYRQRSPSSEGYCFGPFLSTAPLELIMTCLYRAFLLRSCSDTVFSQRTRPCLQYHIKRCSAPCVGKIDAESYKEMVHQAIRFLRGQAPSLRQEMTREMERLSKAQEYDQARMVRDRLEALSHMTTSYQTDSRIPEADVFALSYQHGTSCVQLMCFRQGIPCGAESFFFPDTAPQDAGDIMNAVVRAIYAQNPPPARIILTHPVSAPEDLILLFRHLFQKVPHFVYPRRGDAYRMMKEAQRNGDQALTRQLEGQEVQTELWGQAAELLGIDHIPRRIEIYDNSHHQGDCPVSVMVVATPQGFSKKDYRVFTMHSQDDYDMMRTVMKRRFSGKLPWPDLMIIDGGKGQLAVVCGVLKELGVQGPRVISIAKSHPHDLIYVAEFLRKTPNREHDTLLQTDQAISNPLLLQETEEPVCALEKDLLRTLGKDIKICPLPLPEHHTVLHLIQRLRDEAHRFAVNTHRRVKRRRMTTSLLQQLPGIGPKRHKLLMEHFGSIQAILKASEEDLSALFSKSLALKIKKSLAALTE